MQAAEYTRRFWVDYARGLEYNAKMLEHWVPLWEAERLRDRLSRYFRGVRDGGGVGYIQTTCSPVTQAHVELAKQAADELGLTRVFFIIYPFRFIPGFHKLDVETWASEQRHLPWEERFELLCESLRDARDERLVGLQEAKEWYLESIGIFSIKERLSGFWTGTWYIMRKLQWWARQWLADRAPFVFVCGGDQLNANVDALIAEEGVYEAFRDYSIAQHLLIHDVFAVPRATAKKEIEAVEQFSAPFGCEHRVLLGHPLLHGSVSATQVRFQTLPPGVALEDYLTAGAARMIRARGWWGYK